MPLLPKYQINKCVQRSMEISNKVSIAEIPGWDNLLYSEIHEHSLQDEVIREGNQREKNFRKSLSWIVTPKKKKKLKEENTRKKWGKKNQEIIKSQYSQTPTCDFNKPWFYRPFLKLMLYPH